MTEKILNEVEKILAGFTSPQEFISFQTELEHLGRASLSGGKIHTGNLTSLAKEIQSLNKSALIELFDAIGKLEAAAAHRAENNQSNHIH